MFTIAPASADSPFFPFPLFYASASFFFHCVLQISGVELVIFLIHHNSNNLYDQDKVVVMGDCCYVNPMVRRTFRFLGNPKIALNRIETILTFSWYF